MALLIWAFEDAFPLGTASLACRQRQARSPARMVLRMQQPQPLARDVGVDGGGADVGMAQQQLHRPQIGAVVQQMGGKSVAQGVR